MDPTGVMMTNNHVVEGADSVDVTFTDGPEVHIVGHQNRQEFGYCDYQDQG